MPGKISEYTNDANITNDSLLDYSKPSGEQGAFITRSINLSQLKASLGVTSTPLFINKQVLANVSTTLGFPDVGAQNTEENYEFQSTGAYQRYDATWIQNKLTLTELGSKKNIPPDTIRVFLSGIAPVSAGPLKWQLRLTDTTNSAQSLLLASESSINSQPLNFFQSSVFGGDPPFGVGYLGITRTQFPEFDSSFFALYGISEGVLELHIQTNNNAVILTSCHVEICFP